MKFTPDYKGDLISRKRLMFELGESNMPKKYREFCLRVLSSENLSPTVKPKVKESCEWCEIMPNDWVNPIGRVKRGEPIEPIKANYCPNCGQKLDWED